MLSDQLLAQAHVEPPLEVAGVDAIQWHDEADLVVVGYGGAGVAAALQAATEGASVVALDRFGGGGASALSGGVLYLGGTRIQREAGFDDTPDEMFKYLKLETMGIVSDQTLRRYCEGGQEMLDWLQSFGARFSSAVHTAKTNYPPNDKFLYYSGNENGRPYRDHARPAPRGHRTVGEMYTGYALIGALREAATRHGVRLHAHAPVRRLVVDKSGAVIGVEARQLPEGSAARRVHERTYAFFNRWPRFLQGGLATVLKRRMRAAEQNGWKSLFVRARCGVLLSAGGFVHNRGMMKHEMPRHRHYGIVGTAGCDGSGIRLGQSVGGDVLNMDNPDARTITPPLAFAKGMVVNGEGRRFVNEDCYSAKLGGEIMDRHQRKAWLILDHELYREGLGYIWPKGMLRGALARGLGFGRQRDGGAARPAADKGRVALVWLATVSGILLKGRKGRTLPELARSCGLPADVLQASANAFAAIGNGKTEDPHGKRAELLRPLGAGPYHAIDISADNWFSPGAIFTLGGLRVDEQTGQVLGGDGRGIAGLYAAGRNAIGLPSHFYVSGLSLGDCIFSGRRAGRAIAEKAAQGAAANNRERQGDVRPARAAAN